MVFIRRRDLLRQAISYARAKQTLSFISEVQAKRQPEYNRALIDDCLDLVIWQNACWKKFFSLTGVPFHIVDYESLVENPVQTVNSVISSIGLDSNSKVSAVSASPARQSDSMNEEWRERYLRESSGRVWKPKDFEIVFRARQGKLLRLMRAAERSVTRWLRVGRR